MTHGKCMCLCCVLCRVSLAKRVEYADEMMTHIMDSADNPMQVDHAHTSLLTCCDV